MSENRRPNRRVSYSQLEELWEFLNSHKDIAMGYNKSVQARQHSKTMWETVAMSLNSHGDGAYKSGKAWNSYWVDYKSKLKKLAAANRASQQRTGGGPAAKPMSDLETKFLGLMGEDFGCGIPGARVVPILDLQETNNWDEHAEILPIPMSTPTMPDSSVPPSYSAPSPPIQPVIPPNTPPNTPLAYHAVSPTQLLTGAQNRFPRLRRRRRIGTTSMTAEESRRALVQSSDRRERFDEARNVKLDEIKKELQSLTAAVNNLNETLKSRFRASEPDP